MPAIIHLSDLWEHTPYEILTYDAKSEVGIIMRAWVKHNKLEDITSLLIYDLNDFTPSGTLCNYKEKADSEVALVYYSPEGTLQPLDYSPEGTLQPLEVHSTSHT